MDVCGVKTEKNILRAWKGAFGYTSRILFDGETSGGGCCRFGTSCASVKIILYTTKNLVVSEERRKGECVKMYLHSNTGFAYRNALSQENSLQNSKE